MEIGDLEKCSTSNVQSVEYKPKYLSSQTEAARSSAVTASKATAHVAATAVDTVVETEAATANGKNPST